jgi:hypothetical protein
MKPLGALTELDPSVEGAMQLAACRSGINPVAKALVIRYLLSGVAVFDVMEATPDPRNAGHSISGGSSLLTDGTWTWRLDLAAYVEAYDLNLPATFVEHVAVSNGVCAAPVITAHLVKQATAAWGWA